MWSQDPPSGLALTRTHNKTSAIPQGEAVEIQEKRFGYFPKTFCWRGKQYHVEAVERCWTLTHKKPQLCFRVRCPEGMFDLVQDVRLNAWHLSAVN